MDFLRHARKGFMARIVKTDMRQLRRAVLAEEGVNLGGRNPERQLDQSE